MDNKCSECEPFICERCDLVIYENDAGYICEEHEDSDIEYCSCDECGTCGWYDCQCDAMYEAYKDRLLEDYE